MIKSGLLLPPPLYLPAGVKSARSHSVPAGSVLFLDGYPPNGTKIYDKSGNGYDGNITGAIWKRRKSGVWELSYDGNDYVNFGNGASLQITSDFTVGGWTKIQTGFSAYILAKYNYTNNQRAFYLGWIGVESKVYYVVSDDGTAVGEYATTGTLTDTTKYYQIIGVFKAGVYQKIYINGVEWAGTYVSGSVRASMYNTTEPLLQGACNTPSFVYGKQSSGLTFLCPNAWTVDQIAQSFARERWIYGV